MQKLTEFQLKLRANIAAPGSAFHKSVPPFPGPPPRPPLVIGQSALRGQESGAGVGARNNTRTGLDGRATRGRA